MRVKQQEQLPSNPKNIKHWGNIPSSITEAEVEAADRKVITAVSKLWLGNGNTSHIIIPKTLRQKHGFTKPCFISFTEIEGMKGVLIIRKLENSK